MAIEWIENPDAREATPTTRRFVWKALGARDETEVLNAAPGDFALSVQVQTGEDADGHPVYRAATLRKDPRAKEIAPGVPETGEGSVWECLVDYAEKDEDDDSGGGGGPLMRWIDWAQSTQRRTWGYEENELIYSVADEAYAVDAGNMIGLKSDQNGGWDAEGVDIPVFQGVLNIRKRFAADYYLSVKESQIGHKSGMTNSDVFQGYAPQELVFMGAPIESSSSRAVTVVFKFAIYPTGEVNIDGAQRTIVGSRVYHDLKARLSPTDIGPKVVRAWTNRVFLRTTFSNLLT